MFKKVKTLTDILFQVNNEILPVGIYASMVFMIFVSLTTDWLRYKIVIVIQALCGVFIYFLLSFYTSFISVIVSIHMIVVFSFLNDYYLFLGC